MSEIRNTARAWQEDPGTEAVLFIAESMGRGGQATPIERQERDGQRQLVNSDRLPTDHGEDAPWLALGFTFGEPDPGDPLFMPATLPPGWSRKASDHAMGSSIVDTLGRERVGIFYKAAFYDRSANMHLIGLHWYVQSAVDYGGHPIVLDDEWATRGAVLAEMAKAREEKLARAAEFRGYAADEEHRDAANREACTGHAAENEAAAAKYDAAIEALSSDDN